MDSSAPEPPANSLADEALIRTTCKDMLRAWNARDASAFAAFFTESGAIVGFDGLVVAGSAAIAAYLRDLFARHETPAYVNAIRWVRFLSEDIAIAHGIAGMFSLPTGAINPTLNSVQMITCARRDEGWRIELFQITPAQLHGDPEAVAGMTEELQRRLSDSSD